MYSEVVEHKMILDSILIIVQIAFYLVVGSVAVLTYLKAKKTLLNSVNTEYQKRALQKVEEISEFLISEFDAESENFWANKKMDTVEAAKLMINEFNKEKEMFLKEEKWIGSIPSNTSLLKFDNWVTKVKSDPFVPKEIRRIVVEKLQARISKAREIERQELLKFGDALIIDKGKSDLKYWEYGVHNLVVEKSNVEGVGVSQIEEMVHLIRIGIQKYYEKYDPLK